MEKQMEQIYLLHRVFINTIAYMGLTLGIDNEIMNGSIMQYLQLSPILSNMIVGLGIIMWVIKGVWFVYDHFYLERKERLKKLGDD